MALGLGASADGGVMAPADVRGAGEIEWERVGRVSPRSPIVGSQGGFGPGVDPTYRRDRMVTLPTPGGSAAGVMSTPHTTAVMENWRDLLNVKGSPMPWLLIAALVVLGLLQLRVAGRAGPVRASGSVG
jgi:hypothetical protein